MPLIVSKKDAKKYGATLDSAGNYSVGGKDPSTSSGKSGTRYGATGYDASKDATLSSTSRTSSPSSTSGTSTSPSRTSGSSYATGADAVSGVKSSIASLIKPEFQVAGAAFEADPAAFWNTVTNPKTTYNSIGYANKMPPATNANSTAPTIGSPATTPRPQAEIYSAGGGGGGSAPTSVSTTGGAAPTPTNKDQANKAGIQDTGGASASGGKPGDRQLTDSELRLAYNLIAALSVNPSNDITSTADDYDAAHSNMDSVLSKAYEDALADLPDYEKMKSDAEDLFDLKTKILDERQQALEDRYAEDKASIEADYEGQEQDMKETQKRQTGQMAGGLAAAGAYLGFDNINHSAMLSLEVTHQRELTVLGQAKIAALNTARRAFEDADYALLGEQINAIDKYNEDITKLTQDHFDNTLKLAQEARDNVRFVMEAETFERDKSFDNLDAAVKAGKMPTDKQIKEYAASLGLSETEVRGYVQAGIETANLEKSKNKTELDIMKYDLLKTIDKGTYVTIDGKQYEGLNVPTTNRESSNRILSAEDVMDKFGGSPWAYNMVGKVTYGEAVEYFSQQNPPEDWAQTYYDENLESLMEDFEIPSYILPKYLAEGLTQEIKDQVFYAKAQNAWELEKKNFWGESYGSNLGDFDKDEVSAILGELEVIKGRKVYIDEVRNDYTNYPPSTLKTILNSAKAREKEATPQGSDGETAEDAEIKALTG